MFDLNQNHVNGTAAEVVVEVYRKESHLGIDSIEMSAIESCVLLRI